MSRQLVLRNTLPVAGLFALLALSTDGLAQPWCALPYAPCNPDDQNGTCYDQPPAGASPKCASCNFCQGSPCILQTGNYLASAPGISLATNGLQIDVGVSYQSARTRDGAVGVGWSSTMAAHLTYAVYLFAAPSTYQNLANVVLPDGTRLLFVQDPGTGAFTPPSGRFDTLVRNTDGSFDMALQRSRVRYHFDAQGNLATMTAENGVETMFTFDANGRLQRVADQSGSGRYVDVYWGGDGRLSSARDSAGRQVQYFYDASGALTSVIDPAGRATSYTYEAGKYAPRLKQVRDNWNRVITDVTYDAQGRVKTYTEDGETYTYVYGYLAAYPYLPNNVRKTDGLGNSWLSQYDTDGFIVSVLDGTNSPVINRSFNPDGTMSQETRNSGSQASATAYTYLPDGRLLTASNFFPLNPNDPNGYLRRDYTYDPNFPNAVTSITPMNTATNLRDPNWQAWRYDYYQAGSTSPGSLFHAYRVRDDGVTLDDIATYEYNARSQVTRQTSASGAATDYAYDATTGDLLSVTGPANNDAGTRPVTQYSNYDGSGRPRSLTDPLGRATTYTYDAVGRVLTVTLPKPSVGSPLDFTTSYSYDSYDAVSGLTFTNVTDPNGKLIQLGYDQFGRLAKSVDGAGNATVYTYAHGLLSSIRDANGNTTGYRYYLRDLQYIDMPDGTARPYSYYRGRLLADPSYSYGYDFEGRVRSVWLGQSNESFAYSRTGDKLTSVRHYTGTLHQDHTLFYDSSYRVTSVTEEDRGTLSYTYTLDDRPATVSITGGPTATYTYYPDGSLNTINWSLLGGQFKYNYNLAGQLSQITFPNGQTRGYGYDDQGRLLQLANTLGATNLATFAYGYDVNNTNGTTTMLGQRTSLTATVPAQGFTNALTKYYYDSLYQLSRVDYPAAPPFSTEVDSWTYDAIGNRVTSTVNGSTQNYSYFKNGANPLNGQRLQSDSTNSYTWGSLGTLATSTGPGGSLTFGYDPAKQHLTSIAGAATAAYTYDYLGRRTSKTAGQPTTYLYDGQNLVSETTSSVPKYYLYGPGIDEPLAAYVTSGPSSGFHYFDVDGLGSIVATNGPTGTVEHNAVFDAWGVARSEIGTRFHPFTYTGREVGEAGALFYRARFYQPSVGRFSQEDPLGFDGGPHLYNYAASSPMSFVDPEGLAGMSPGLAGTVARGLGFAGRLPISWTAFFEFNSTAPGAMDMMTTTALFDALEAGTLDWSLERRHVGPDDEVLAQARELMRQHPGWDICDALKALYQNARKCRDFQMALRIRMQEKRFGCSGGPRDPTRRR